MRAIWNGFVSFGLVTIPVSVGLAQQRSDVSFRTLARETGQPVKQKRWDPVNDREVTGDDTVKGWEVSKGRYLPVEDEELEQFAARQEKTIRILQFVDAAEVDPVFFERAYWLEPQERAERPYKLLMSAMEGKDRAAIGRFVLSTKEHLVLLRASEGMLTLETLYYPEDIRLKDRNEISERLADVDVADAELQMAEQLVEGLARPFEPEAYPNETRKALLDFLHAKAEGTEIAEPEEAPEPAPVIDLMAALKASLAAAGGGDASPTRPRRSPPRSARSSSKKDGDGQLDIEQGRLRGVEGGGEGDGAAKKPARKRSTTRKTAAKAQGRGAGQEDGRLPPQGLLARHHRRVRRRPSRGIPATRYASASSSVSRSSSARASASSSLAVLAAGCAPRPRSSRRRSGAPRRPPAAACAATRRRRRCPGTAAARRWAPAAR